MKRFLTALAACLFVCLSALPSAAVGINSRGQVTGCVAGGVAHIDGKVISVGAGGCNWVDDETIVYQACDVGDHCIVQTYNQVTGAKATVWNGGAIDITAGGGVWACFCGAGVQSSTGGAYTGSSLTMNQSGTDGTFVMKVVYQDWGPYDGVEPSGARWRITDAGVGVIVSDFQLLGGRRATWLDSRFGPTNNFGASIKWLGGWWLRSAFIDGKLWVMYQNAQTARLFLHPADSFLGYIVGTDTLTYEPAIRVLPNGAVRVAWSTDPSETPTGTKVITVDMNAPRVNLEALMPLPPAPVPTPVPVPTPTPAPTPAPAGFPKDLKADLVAERAKYGALLNQAQAGELINAVAFKNKDLGFGLLRKDGGNNCPVAGLDVRVSCDWIVNSKTGTGCDVLGSGPDPDNAGPSNPGWCSGEPFDTSKFVAPVAGGVTPPPPPPPPPTDDPRIAQLKAQVAELETSIAAERAAKDGANTRVSELETERDQLKAKIDELTQQLNAPVRCEAKIPSYLRALGIRVGCSIVR